MVAITDFSGLVLDADPVDIPTGAAQDQLNVQSSVPGELTVRQGYKVVQFEDVS